jgi:uncharacterized protein YjbJ (UPF0337 family)
MTRSKRKYVNTKEKLGGKVKEAAGKISGNEQLELKGKIQVSKAAMKEKLSAANMFDAIKERIAGLINNKIDKKRHKKRK